MIVSVHISKTAGNSFRNALAAHFGMRLAVDYGDMIGWDSPEIEAMRAESLAQIKAKLPELERECDVMHGHFRADKYLGLFKTVTLCTFFRDPVQRLASKYAYIQRHPRVNHPMVQLVHRQKISFDDFIDWPPARNVHLQFLGPVPLGHFVFIGMTEELAKSLALFNAMFNTRLEHKEDENINPEAVGAGYSITDEQRRRIEKANAADYDLHRRAQEIYARLCQRFLNT